jgi:hypothetical protein
MEMKTIYLMGILAGIINALFSFDNIHGMIGWLTSSVFSFVALGTEIKNEELNKDSKDKSEQK